MTSLDVPQEEELNNGCYVYIFGKDVGQSMENAHNLARFFVKNECSVDFS